MSPPCFPVDRADVTVAPGECPRHALEEPTFRSAYRGAPAYPSTISLRRRTGCLPHVRSRQRATIHERAGGFTCPLSPVPRSLSPVPVPCPLYPHSRRQLLAYQPSGGSHRPQLGKGDLSWQV